MPNVPTSYRLPQARLKMLMHNTLFGRLLQGASLSIFLVTRREPKKKESIVRSLTSVSKPLFIKEDWTSCSRGPEGEKVKSFLLFGFHSDVCHIFGKTVRDAGIVAHKHIGGQRYQKLEQLWGHLIAIKFDDEVNNYQVVI